MYKNELESMDVSRETLKQLAAYRKPLLGKNRNAADIAHDRTTEEWIQMLDVSGFTLPFDYPDWLSRQNADLSKTEQVISVIKNGNLNTVRGTIASIIRRNRFESGYLETLIQEGLLPVFFERLDDFLSDKE